MWTGFPAMSLLSRVDSPRLRARGGPASRSRLQVRRFRPPEELRVALLLRDEPVDERVTVLRRAEFRDVDELRTRLLRHVVHSPDAEDVELVHRAFAQACVHLTDHFLLAVRMRVVRVDLPVQRRMRVGGQADQRGTSFLVALRCLDHGDLCTVGRMHYLPDVGKPLRPRRLELSTDEVTYVLARRRLALGAV